MILILIVLKLLLNIIFIEILIIKNIMIITSNIIEIIFIIIKTIIIIFIIINLYKILNDILGFAVEVAGEFELFIEL